MMAGKMNVVKIDLHVREWMLECAAWRSKYPKKASLLIY
jgi:hypothetical protein